MEWPRCNMCFVLCRCSRFHRHRLSESASSPSNSLGICCNRASTCKTHIFHKFNPVLTTSTTHCSYSHRLHPLTCTIEGTVQYPFCTRWEILIAPPGMGGTCICSGCPLLPLTTMGIAWLVPWIVDLICQFRHNWFDEVSLIESSVLFVLCTSVEKPVISRQKSEE